MSSVNNSNTQQNWQNLLTEAYNDGNNHKYIYKNFCGKTKLFEKGTKISCCYRKVTFLDILKKLPDPSQIQDTDKIRDIINKMSEQKNANKPTGMHGRIKEFFSKFANVMTFQGIGWHTSTEYAFTNFLQKLPTKVVLKKPETTIADQPLQEAPQTPAPAVPDPITAPPRKLSVIVTGDFSHNNENITPINGAKDEKSPRTSTSNSLTVPLPIPLDMTPQNPEDAAVIVNNVKVTEGDEMEISIQISSPETSNTDDKAYAHAKKLVSGNDKLNPTKRKEAEIIADNFLERGNFEYAMNLYARIISYHSLDKKMNTITKESFYLIKKAITTCQQLYTHMIKPSYGLSELAINVLINRWNKHIKNKLDDETNLVDSYFNACSAIAILRDFKLDKDSDKIEKRLSHKLANSTEQINEKCAKNSEESFESFTKYMQKKKKKNEQLEFEGTFNGVLTSLQGNRKEMEDVSHIDTVKFKIADVEYNFPFFAVYDGHSGSECAEFAKKRIIDILSYELSQKTDFTKLHIWNALKIALVRLHYEWQMAEEIRVPEKNDNLKISDAGSTALVSLMIDNTLWVANVGDSRGVLANSNNNVLYVQDLSKDQKPRRIEGNEFTNSIADSIEKRGGRLMRNNTLNGSLGVARSLGHYGEFAVSARPKITMTELLNTFSGSTRMILATDGVWDNIKSAEAANLVMQEDNVTRATEVLTGTALNRSARCDNVTAVIVDLS